MALEWSVESLSVASLSDDELVSRLVALVSQSRSTEAALVLHIGEMDARRLYARHAAPSMFVYCTDVLHLTEAAAYRRITVARAAREHPVLLERLADGRIHLTGIATLAPHLTPENRDAMLSRAIHKSKKQIEELVAELAPRPDAPSSIRKLPDRAATLVVPKPAEAPIELAPERVLAPAAEPVFRPSPPAAPVFQPLSPARYKVQFTAGPDLREDLQRLRALLRSDVPDGDLAAIIGKAVREMRQRLEARRFAQTKSPRKQPARIDDSSRYVPAEVRRVVYRRDGGQCRFVDDHGRRCPERHRLVYHHQHAYGLGGGTNVENICLMCEEHNRYRAELDYGKEVMSRYTRRPAVPKSSTG
jgi:5-methylcytosine-specific restriction endonuclease McrA